MDKPVGPTSHDVVARVRRALGVRSVGHTGTLDPFASGLLAVLVGRATRLARFVEAQPKTYLAVARLGWATTTDDATGAPLEAAGPTGEPEIGEVERVLTTFLGPQTQRPPAFSAKHVDGERSYRKARRGELVELPEVQILVHALELTGYCYPELHFRATVSAGTYVRALARNLGERLGSRAHLTALRREAIGALRVERAIPLEAVQPGMALLPAEEILGHLPRVVLEGPERELVVHGRAVDRAEPVSGTVLLMHGDRLVGVAAAGGGRLRPTVVLEGA